MSFLEVKNASKNFGSFKAVDCVSFGVDKGEVFGLLGPNGAGKSTLISMITTLLEIDAGEICVNGLNIGKQSLEVKKLLGLVPQEIALYPTLTAKENLDFWGRMYGLGGRYLKEQVENVIEIAGLKDRAGDRIEKYSGGMKRRINIAAALLHRPQILIMDEPTVGIDPQSRNHILETVLKLNKEGMTVVYTSHYMEEVEYLCSRIAIMDHGKIIACGSKEELRKLVGNCDTINIGVANFQSGIEEHLQKIHGVKSVTFDQNSIQILADNADEIVAKAISLLDENSMKIHSVNVEQANLESVFLHLTGRALRD